MAFSENGNYTNYIYQTFDAYPQLSAFSSTVQSPFINVRNGKDAEEQARLLEDYEKKWLEELQILPEKLYKIKQVHGDAVACPEQAGFAGECDSLVTNKRGYYLRIVTADCLPVFLFDPVNECIGLVHGGWRGVSKKIITKTLRELKNKFGSSPEDVKVAVGPFIQHCCYEVGEEVASQFNREFSTPGENAKFMLDLGKAAKEELQENGIKAKNIDITSECTYCKSDHYFSARRESQTKGRIIHLFGMQELP